MTPQDKLSQIIFQRNVPHALLFSGPVGEKEEAAYTFAGNLICQDDAKRLQHEQKIRSRNHPDIHHFRPEGKTGMHTIQTIRQLTTEVAMRPNESRLKIFIIYEADRMLPTSANALLKTLEEPAERTVIILLSSNPEKLLPTILSRCQTILFPNDWHRPKSLATEQLLDILSRKSQLKMIHTVLSTIEEEKKTWEKSLRQNLPADLTATQKDEYEKEVEGVVALRFQEKMISLLRNILEWYRDVEIAHLQIPEQYFFFPEYREFLKKTKPIAFSQLHQWTMQTRLALDRLMKPAFCFEVLLMKILNA